MQSSKQTAVSQVAFLSVQDVLDLVSRVGIESFIKGLANTIEDDFKRWAQFDKSPRFAAHSPEGVIELMPTSDGQRFSFKYVNGHPKNTLLGLQTVTAFGVLADVDSGYPVLLSEMTLLTALRTGATSALMATYLAPANSTCMALIGNGAQSEFQAFAFRTLLGINTLRLYDVDTNASKKCQANLIQYGFDVTICTSPEQALVGADIITTCTADKRNATILTTDMVKDGVHVNAIGGDCPGKAEIDKALLLRADVFVEYEEQTRIEGDIQQLAADFPVIEMHNVIAGHTAGRTTQTQLTIFDGVGFATEDFSALCYVHKLMKQYLSVKELELIARPDEPRNLFGLFKAHNQTCKVA
ncbi:ornithine cyclodeaminase [Paraglaciecola polaris]|uniref:Ornithine cyclodeaminase n=1 Tax=Paraglaciecola polaris LMG 21857 TaxID=1129793 RepID=K6YFR6_9ALTE|nr:ornithine cyclodeaminase [Paraglaciecola polaris]GAC31584.1 ornithine cyclodeaminase [Paraglaciecola polaris LMG 21857]